MYTQAFYAETFVFRKPGLVKQFIADLHSGKLHREFHHGPDPATQPVSYTYVFRECLNL